MKSNDFRIEPAIVERCVEELSGPGRLPNGGMFRAVYTPEMQRGNVDVSADYLSSMTNYLTPVVAVLLGEGRYLLLGRLRAADECLRGFARIGRARQDIEPFVFASEFEQLG